MAMYQLYLTREAERASLNRMYTSWLNVKKFLEQWDIADLTFCLAAVLP